MPVSCIVCGGPVERISLGRESACMRPECRFVVEKKGRLSATAYAQFLREQSLRIRGQDRRDQERANAIRAGNEREAAENSARRQALLLAPESPVAEAYPLLPVPHNGRRVINLSEKRKRAARDWLTRLISRALALPRDTEDDGGNEPDPVHPSAHFLRAACTLCTGACCLEAREVAYLKAVTLVRVMRTHPALRPRDILERYLSYLPHKIIAGGCVYQAEKGCALPAEFRANVCHKYFCIPLKEFRQAWYEREAPQGVVFIVRNREHWSFPVGSDQGILKTVLVTGTETVPLD